MNRDKYVGKKCFVRVGQKTYPAILAGKKLPFMRVVITQADKDTPASSLEVSDACIERVMAGDKTFNY